jgi:hypothetical protein
VTSVENDKRKRSIEAYHLIWCRFVVGMDASDAKLTKRTWSPSGSQDFEGPSKERSSTSKSPSKESSSLESQDSGGFVGMISEIQMANQYLSSKM